MLEVLSAPDHVVALRVSGRVEEADIESGIHAIERTLCREERICLFAEIDITGMAPGALAKNLTYSISQLRHLHRFSRVAVVTDQEWMRAMAEVQNRILPSVEVKTFPPSEWAEAMSWVSVPASDTALNEVEGTSHTSSVRPIETTRPDVIAFEVNGRIKGEDMHDLIKRFDEALNAHERLRVLAKIGDFSGVSLEALRNETLWSVKMRGLKQIKRYAIVGGPDWMARVARWSAPLVPIETRYFDRTEEAMAWQWLEAEPI